MAKDLGKSYFYGRGVASVPAASNQRRPHHRIINFMPNPFPGMNPYLEPHWLDVQTALIGEARRKLNQMLPNGVAARAEERVAVESNDEIDPIIERYIRIIDPEGQLITVLEFISPTNKRQPGLDSYREKRAILLTGGVHVVEVDLIRAGNWRTLMRPETCPADAVSTYRATIRIGGSHPSSYLFPVSLRDALPAIPIPLRSSDTPVRLPLQGLLNTVYEEGRYDQTIDYAQPLDPPFEQEDATWADNLLRAARRR